MSEKIITQQLKEENKKLNVNENENEMKIEIRMRMRTKTKNLKKNEIVKDASIKELIEEPKEIKIRNWLDKNKFKEIWAIIDSNKFGHKSKIGDFKYIDIKDLIIQDNKR